MLDGALLCVAKFEEECVEHGFLRDEAQRGVSVCVLRSALSGGTDSPFPTETAVSFPD